MYIELNGLKGYLYKYNDINTITKDINSLNTYIKLLENQRKQLIMREKINNNLKINCPKCGSKNLYLQRKANGNLIGLYCKDCKEKNKKRTGYIKFLSSKEYENIKYFIKEIEN